jgi:hypothetical protein
MMSLPRWEGDLFTLITGGEMNPVKLLSDNHGTLYEIPLILTGYGIICAVAYPQLQRILPGNHYIGIMPLLLLGFGVVLCMGKMISIGRVFLCGVPSGVWIFLLLSIVTLPFMRFNSETVLITATLLAQTYGSFRLDLWLAERKKRKNEGPDTDVR